MCNPRGAKGSSVGTAAKAPQTSLQCSVYSKGVSDIAARAADIVSNKVPLKHA